MTVEGEKPLLPSGGSFAVGGGEAASCPVSHNLHGQKLGRKGRVTRERILAACSALLAEPNEAPISLSAVARKAGLGMTSLYNYFTDLTELLLAVLEPVMETAESTYLGMLREPWPDEELGERCLAFMRALLDFWQRNARLLHLRNAMSDAHDQRMSLHRVQASQPMIFLLAWQMGGDPAMDVDSPIMGMATVLMTGIERTVTVATDDRLRSIVTLQVRRRPDHYIEPEARLMELAIRDTRQRFGASLPHP